MIQFKDLPVEIQERMLDEQVRQGNPRDAEVFERYILAEARNGGFTWGSTDDGHNFWAETIRDGNFAVFYEKYPKHLVLKVIPLHIKVLNSKGLLEEIAEKLLMKWHDEVRPKKVEIDWFEYGGFWWSANAEIEADYEVTQYDYDTPPEIYCRGMSVIIGNIECTDDDGNLVLVDYFDDERTRINEDDFVRKSIIDMEMEGN